MNFRRSHDPAAGKVKRTSLARLIPICAFGLLGMAARLDAPIAEPEEAPSPPPAQGEEESPPKETTRKKTSPGRPAARKPASAPTSTGGAPAEPAPLRFTDLDLEKYHRPVSAGEDEEGLEAGAEGVSPAAVPGRTPSAPSAAVNARPVRRPTRLAPPPPPDPLKPFKDREARERFRSKQLQDLRDKIGQIESRLQYLKMKREALQNPAAPLQVGRTRGPDDPPDPVPGPGTVPVQKEPAPAPPPKNPPSVFPGAGRIAVAPLFPALPPPQTDEDREKDKRMKVRDLLAEVEKEIEAVEAELEEARTILVDIETRFGAEAGIR